MPDICCVGDDVSSVNIMLLLRYCGTVVLAMRLLQNGGTVVGVTHPNKLWARSDSWEMSDLRRYWYQIFL